MAVRFGLYEIPASQVFWKGTYAFGIVNIRPFTQHHLLLSPYRQVRFIEELEQSEVAELMQMTARVSQVLNKGQSRITIQNGSDAGQSVFHLHVHIIPLTESTQRVQVDARVADRTTAEMAAEAATLRSLFE